MAKKSTGKRLRFEIFKRDGFTCQYCGQRPPDVVLELDHIHPRAAGGTDDELNLITACADCNRGKSDKKLGDVHPRPDADLKYLEVQQEIAETRRYLGAAEKLRLCRNAVIDQLLLRWYELIGDRYEPTEKQWNIWLGRYTAEEIEFSMERTAPRYQCGQFGNNESAAIYDIVRYMSGIMRCRRNETSGGIVQERVQ